MTSRTSYLLRLVAVFAIIGTATISVFAKDLNTPLLEAVESGNLELVSQLIDEGAQLEARNDHGWTALIIAAKAGNSALVKLLIEKGADVNARSSSSTGSTVLCFATTNDDPKLLELLVQHGADINGRSRNGATALSGAVTEKKLRAATFLISKRAKVNQLTYMNDGGHRFTPLMCAAGNGDVRLIDLLLKNQASLEKRNNAGNTAFMIAAMQSNAAVRLKQLINCGANVNAKTPEGSTALIYAVENKHLENVKVLLAAGADPFACLRITEDPDETGRDALAVANFQGATEIATLILEAQQRITKSRGNE